MDFNANLGSGTMQAQMFSYDAAARTLTTNAFTRPGYTFNGWNTEADGSGVKYADGASVRNLASTANDTVTLYAQWTANTYIVEFDSNGGSGSMQAQTFTYDVAQNLPVNGFTKGSDPFIGWNTKANGGGIQYGDKALVRNLTDELNGIVTLNARWGDNSAAQIGSNRYDTLQAAFNAVSDGQTIQMLRDITEKIEIPDSSSKSFTLDLNGKTLLGAPSSGINISAISHFDRGKLTITDTAGGGKITSTDSASIRGTISLYTPMSSNISLENTGGTIENTHEYGNAIYNNGYGSIIISGGTVEKPGGGRAIDNVGTGNITISGGRVSSDSVVIYNRSSGNINISGGTLYSSNGYAIINDSNGNIAISDTAEVISDASYEYAPFLNGTIYLGGDYATLEITGGTVANAMGSAIYNKGFSMITISGTPEITSANPSNGHGTITIDRDFAPVLEITGGTIENTCENGNAIYYTGSGRTKIPSGSPVIKGGGMAVNIAPNLSGYTDVQVTASTDVSGTPEVPYVEEDIQTYKYITFEQ